jgi:hypothetical protein
MGEHPTGLDRLARFEAWKASAPKRQTSLEVIAEIEAIARRINGGAKLPRPYPLQNGESR